ncbi:MAG: DUF1330 domain-containing protein [Verrucomicrobia bacterium]|nr:DUF1330 domain-containing protein [Verrucomicrobiota bacterium]
MKIRLKAIAAVLAGVGIGVIAMHGLQGGQAKAPPAFVVSNIEVTDPAGYQKYGEAAAAVVATYHGKILVRGGKAYREWTRMDANKNRETADQRRWTSDL